MKSNSQSRYIPILDLFTIRMQAQETEGEEAQKGAPDTKLPNTRTKADTWRGRGRGRGNGRGRKGRGRGGLRGGRGSESPMIVGFKNRIPAAKGMFVNRAPDTIDPVTSAYFSPMWFDLVNYNPCGSVGSIAEAAWMEHYNDIKKLTQVYFKSDNPYIPEKLLRDYFTMSSDIVSVYIVASQIRDLNEKYLADYFKTDKRSKLNNQASQFYERYNTSRTKFRRALEMLEQQLSRYFLPEEHIKQIIRLYRPYYVDNFAYTSIVIPVCKIPYNRELSSNNFDLETYLGTDKEWCIFPFDNSFNGIYDGWINILKNLSLSLTVAADLGGQYYDIHTIMNSVVPEYNIENKLDISDSVIDRPSAATTFRNINQVINTVSIPKVVMGESISVDENGRIMNRTSSLAQIYKHEDDRSHPPALNHTNYVNNDTRLSNEIILDREYFRAKLDHDQRGDTFELSMEDFLLTETAYHSISNNPSPEDLVVAYVREPGLVTTINSRVGVNAVYFPDQSRTSINFGTSYINTSSFQGRLSREIATATGKLSYGSVVIPMLEQGESSNSFTTFDETEVLKLNQVGSNAREFVVFNIAGVEDDDSILDATTDMALGFANKSDCKHVFLNLQDYTSIQVAIVKMWYSSNLKARINEMSSGSDLLQFRQQSRK